MSLLKSSAVVGGMTMVSRVMGFVRDILIASSLGTGPVAEAFVYAFTFPNLFRRFFGEGAFNSAFVPLYAKRVEGEGEASARVFAGQALSVLLFALIVVTIVAELCMGFLVAVIAPGFLDDPEKFDLTVLFTRIAFPYLTFVSLVALLGGILNAHRRFAAAAAAPILLNIVLISAIVGWGHELETPGHALIYGVFVAGIAQFLALVWAVHRIKALPRLPRPRLTPQVRRLIRLGIPGAIAAGIVQINLVIGGMIASLADGARATLYYADRIYQLPLGVIGVAMGVVLLPELARRLRAGDESGALSSMNRALELSLFFTIPAAVALAVMPLAIVSVLFERGAFDHTAAVNTSMALAAFAFGLPSFVMIKVFTPGFFAREDTKTPMRFAAVNVTVNIVLSLILFFWIGFVGIAIATSVAGWVNVLLLWRRLGWLGQFRLDQRSRHRLPRVALASLLMGLALYFGQAYTVELFAGSGLGAIFGLICLVALGLGVFVWSAFSLKAIEVADLKSAVRG